MYKSKYWCTPINAGCSRSWESVTSAGRRNSWWPLCDGAALTIQQKWNQTHATRLRCSLMQWQQCTHSAEMAFFRNSDGAPTHSAQMAEQPRLPTNQGKLRLNLLVRDHRQPRVFVVCLMHPGRAEFRLHRFPVHCVSASQEPCQDQAAHDQMPHLHYLHARPCHARRAARPRPKTRRGDPHQPHG